MIYDDNKRNWYRPNNGERYAVLRVKGKLRKS